MFEGSGGKLGELEERTALCRRQGDGFAGGRHVDGVGFPANRRR